MARALLLGYGRFAPLHCLTPGTIQVCMKLLLAGTGYATEAVTYVLGLHNVLGKDKDSLWITNHGNEPKLEVLQKMDKGVRKSLLQMLHIGYSESAFLDRTAILICHSWPGDYCEYSRWAKVLLLLTQCPQCLGSGTWSAPEPFVGYTGTNCPQYPIHEAAYVIGRTMWETDHLPPDVVKRCNNMHEIWVPCEHNREVSSSLLLQSGPFFVECLNEQRCLCGSCRFSEGAG